MLQYVTNTFPFTVSWVLFLGQSFYISEEEKGIPSLLQCALRSDCLPQGRHLRVHHSQDLLDLPIGCIVWPTHSSLWCRPHTLVCPSPLQLCSSLRIRQWCQAPLSFAPGRARTGVRQGRCAQGWTVGGTPSLAHAIAGSAPERRVSFSFAPLVPHLSHLSSCWLPGQTFPGLLPQP